MPAGTGPSATKVTGTSIAAAEVAVATFTGNWQQGAGQAGNQGMLLTPEVNFTPGASQTLLTLRVRQGNGTGGALVGIAHPITTVAAQQGDFAITEFDTSAFAQAQQQGQYTLTAQQNAAGPGTVNQAILVAETTAPIT